MADIKHSTLQSLIMSTRARKGISQDKMASLIGINANTYRELESGRTIRPQLPTLQKVADVAGITLAEIMKLST